MKYRVIRKYDAAYTEGLTAGPGEKLLFEKRATEWAGWIWCTSETGAAGWVPEAWVEMHGTECTLTRDFRGTELSVEPGQEVTVTLSESGWALVRNVEGRCGWVPLECLEASGEP